MPDLSALMPLSTMMKTIDNFFFLNGAIDNFYELFLSLIQTADINSSSCGLQNCFFFFLLIFPFGAHLGR